jgi:DNA-binding transcriptional LysR family regulator
MLMPVSPPQARHKLTCRNRRLQPALKHLQRRLPLAAAGFDHYDLHEMAIAAVLSQQGVALVPKMYVESELRSGTPRPHSRA